MNPYTVDVIIPTYKPGKQFIRLLHLLQKQTYPINRIIVMNTTTGIFPMEECRNISILEVFQVEPKEFDHGGTRNRAAHLSNADMLLFMTQDAVPANEYMIEKLLLPFSDPEVAASYGRQLPTADCRVIERYTRSFNYPGTSHIQTRQDIDRIGIKAFFCSNVCAAYVNDIYKKSGGFITKTIFNEDMIYAGKVIKKGYKIAYQADAKVVHSHNYSNIQQLRRNFDLGVSQAGHPEIFGGIKSESEGIKLVKNTAKHLLKIKKPWLLLDLCLKSASKLCGYKLGWNYRKLPGWLIKKCTMNPRYWLE